MISPHFVNPYYRTYDNPIHMFIFMKKSHADACARFPDALNSSQFLRSLPPRLPSERCSPRRLSRSRPHLDLNVRNKAGNRLILSQKDLIAMMKYLKLRAAKKAEY